MPTTAAVATRAAGRGEARPAGTKAAGGAKSVTGGKQAHGSKAASGTAKTRSVAEAASNHKADAKGYVFINGRRVRMISTKGVGLPKKSRSASHAEQAAEEARAAIRAIKTRLSRKELMHYRQLLLIERAVVLGDLGAKEAEALRSSGGNLSHMPIHMADIGTDTFDQDFMLGLAENDRAKIREIDEALSRIEDRTYGVCQLTGEQIPKSRLNAKPWAKYTVDAARQIEGGLRP